jgi:hypothetical protein
MTPSLDRQISRSILIIAVTGLVQDPLRKALPGQPAYWVMLFLLPAICGLFWQSRDALLLALMSRGHRGLVRLLLGMIVVSASFARIWPSASGENLNLLQLGLIAPFSGIVGFFWGALFIDNISSTSRQQIVRRLCLLTGVFCIGTLVELFAAHDHSLMWLGPMPPYRPWYRTIDADRFRMLCGFFRSPETAGWFSAMLMPWICAIATVPSATKDKRWGWPLLSAFAVFAVFVCVLAGRRKMQLTMLLAALGLVGLLHWSGERNSSRRCLRVVVMSLLAGCLLVACVPKAELYLGYFSTSPVHAPLRTLESTVIPILSSAEEIPWFGKGLGEMTPGRQHVGGKSLMYSEGGMVRVFVETGWIGLPVFVVILLILITRCLAPFRDQPREIVESCDADRVLIACATSTVIASVFAFLIGHQVFGDPLVMFATGAALAIALPRGKHDARLVD